MTDLKALLPYLDIVLFDMDGTIVNTEPLHARAAVHVMKDLGIEIDLEACLAQYYGMTDTAVLKATCPELSDHEIKNAIDKKNFYLRDIFKQLKPNEKIRFITPGLFEFLTILKQQKKFIGVVSASEDMVVEDTLDCFGLNQFLDLKMGRGQTALTKPFPDPYLEAIRRLQSVPEKTLIFEDSPTGLQSAKSSGAKVIRVTTFAHSDENLHHHEIKDFFIY